MASAPWDSTSSSGSTPFRSDFDMRRPSDGQDGRVDDHVGERDLAHELDPHHQHPRHPQVDDLAGGREHVAGVVALQARIVLVRPADGGKRPQRRREPRVEHVGVALERRRAAGGAGGRLVELDRLMAVGAVPDRDLMPPPQLARDAPRPDVVHPVEVGVGLVGRDEPHPARAHLRVRGRGELVHVHEPLQRDQRLDAVAGAVAVAHLVLVVLLAAEQPQGEQRVAHPLAGLAHGQPGELAGELGHAPVVADRRELGQAVAAADLEVVGIVAGRDLERAGAEVHLHVRVGDDRHLAVDQRHDRGAADQVPVALVVGMHGDGGVGQDRLGPHGCDRHELVAALDRVAHLVQGVVGVLVAHLEVGDRRGAGRAPVDQAVVAVDVALAVQPHEHRQHRPHVALVHREPLVLVVERAAEPLELLDDGRAGLLAPPPHPLEEPLPAEVEAGQALGPQLLLDHGMHGDRGVVGAADPERVAALHPPQPDERVLERAVERVAHVQLAGHVRRRVARSRTARGPSRAGRRTRRSPPSGRRSAARPRHGRSGRPWRSIVVSRPAV